MFPRKDAMLKKKIDEAITAEATWEHLGKSSMEELFMSF